MKPPDRQRDIQLSCGCVRQYPSTCPPRKGDDVWCVRHPNTPVTAVGSTDTESRYRCAEFGCRVAKRWGEDEASARRGAARHALRTGHKVHIYKGDTRTDTIDPGNAQGVLDDLLNDRIKRANESQLILKDFLATDTQPLP